MERLGTVLRRTLLYLTVSVTNTPSTPEGGSVTGLRGTVIGSDLVTPVVHVDVAVLGVARGVPVGWLHYWDVHFDEAFEGWVSVRLSNRERFLFKDREVVFPAGVNVIPLLDEGSSSSVLVVDIGRGGSVGDELENV